MSDFAALNFAFDMDCQIECLFFMRIPIFFRYGSLIFALQLNLMSESSYDDFESLLELRLFMKCQDN